MYKGGWWSEISGCVWGGPEKFLKFRLNFTIIILVAGRVRIRGLGEGQMCMHCGVLDVYSTSIIQTSHDVCGMVVMYN